MKIKNLAKALSVSVLMILLLLCSSALAESLPEDYLSGTRTWTSPFPYYISSSMRVTFTDASEFHPNDTVCISNALDNGELKESYILAGDQIAGKTVQVLGTELTIQVSTSYGGMYVGYQVEKIECVSKFGSSAIFNRDKTYDIVINGSSWSDSWLIALRDYKTDDFELGKLVIPASFTCSFTEDIGMPEYENRGTITSGSFPNSVVYNYGTISGGTFDDVSNESTGVITGGTINGTLYNNGTITDATINGDVVQGSLPDVADFSYTVSGGAVTITGYSGTNASLVIPSKIKGKSVTAIKEAAFTNNSSITSVYIPDSVTSIGKNAFYRCASLESVTLPQNLTRIESFTFKGCSNLKEIIIPDGVTYLGNEVFYDCSSLASVTMPENLTHMGYSVFFNCSSLASIVIPNGVSEISWQSFRFCSSLTSVSLPQNLESIGDYAFCGCSCLTDVTIPESVISIGASAFYGCSSLTSIVIPESTTSLGSGIFQDCSSLASATLPENLESIEDYTFYGCKNLTAIAIPESVTSIGYDAFGNCSSLKTIELPEGVTLIENSVFTMCTSLTSIELPESLTSIGDMAFYGCSRLSSITIPYTVSSIGSSALGSCSANLVVSCHYDSAAHIYAINNGIAVEAEAHMYENNGRIEPDCENPGGDQFFCTICGNIHIEEEEALGHDYEISAAVASSCTTPGSITYTCTRCSESYTEEQAALGHDHQVSGCTVTCETAGATTYTCTRCGDSYDEEQAALGHDYQESGSTATCGRAGVTTYTCTRCGDSYDEEQAALGHQYENGVCVRCEMPELPPETDFLQQIFDSEVIVKLPKGMYLSSAPTETKQNWIVFTDDAEVPAFMITMEKLDQKALTDWGGQMQNYGLTVSYIESDKGVSIVEGHKSVSNGFEAFAIFNSGNFSYGISATSLKYAYYELYCQIIDTLLELEPVSSSFTMNLPKDIRIIEDYAFQNSSVGSVIIPEGCETIGRGAFADCTLLGRAYIPASVTTIEKGAFENCPYLIIYAPADSTAIEFARAWGIIYIQQ